jgi:hypothetical protein
MEKTFTTKMGVEIPVKIITDVMIPKEFFGGKNKEETKVMKKFEDLEFDKITDEPYMSGVRSRMVFENGYGVSVISHTYSYGGKDGLFEIAVLDKKGELTYKTPVTNDVIGYLKPEEVTEIMEHVQKL